MRDRRFVTTLAGLLLLLGTASGQQPGTVAPAPPGGPNVPPGSHPQPAAQQAPTTGPQPAGDPATANTPPAPPADPLLFQSVPLRVKLGFEATVQPTWGVDSWWHLSQRFAPDANYAPDRFWTEGWLKPGVRTDLSVTDRLAVYSGVSYVASGNLGKDVF